MSKTQEQEKVEELLKQSDRCDRCGAQAFILAKGLNGELMFCNHHFTAHKDKISEWAFEIIDESNKIN